MRSDRRKSERRATLDAIEFRSHGLCGTGRLLNVGARGAFVATDQLPTEGESVTLLLPTETSPIELEGTIRWVGPRESDGMPGFGVEIHKPPQEYLDLVETLSIRDGRGTGRRVAPRVEVSLPVAIELGSLVDDGLLCDISFTGARLEQTGLTPNPGDRITLTFALSMDQDPFDVVCRVARRTENGGYAVQFEAVDPRLKAAVDAAASTLRSFPDANVP